MKNEAEATNEVSINKTKTGKERKEKVLTNKSSSSLGARTSKPRKGPVGLEMFKVPATKKNIDLTPTALAVVEGSVD